MKLPLPYRLAAAAGLWLSSLGYAQEPARLPVGSSTAPAAISADQQLADAVAARLAQAPHLRGYQVEIAVSNGSVEVVGAAADNAQRDEILRVARNVPGVMQILNGIVTPSEIQATSGQGPLAAPTPFGQGPMGAPQLAGMPGGVTIDPMPVGGPGAASLHPPSMPPYSWPTYAPYNNYSRVGYPDQYPAAAFPFIGPFYPFPKVPPGFRAIKLEWEDGHWFYGRTSTKRDMWTVRYW